MVLQYACHLSSFKSTVPTLKKIEEQKKHLPERSFSVRTLEISQTTSLQVSKQKLPVYRNTFRDSFSKRFAALLGYASLSLHL